MYKDLSLKEKAKVIREGVRLGLNSIDDILSLYDEAVSYLQGGPIVSPYGQWKYPGKDTIIPSNNITMDNVNYPVLGVSDTGDTKVMIPWNDYKFRGSMVYEHPLIGNQFQLGGLAKPFSYEDIPDVRYLKGGHLKQGTTSSKIKFKIPEEILAEKYGLELPVLDNTSVTVPTVTLQMKNEYLNTPKGKAEIFGTIDEAENTNAFLRKVREIRNSDNPMWFGAYFVPYLGLGMLLSNATERFMSGQYGQGLFDVGLAALPYAFKTLKPFIKDTKRTFEFNINPTNVNNSVRTEYPWLNWSSTTELSPFAKNARANIKPKYDVEGNVNGWESVNGQPIIQAPKQSNVKLLNQPVDNPFVDVEGNINEETFKLYLNSYLFGDITTPPSNPFIANPNIKSQINTGKFTSMVHPSPLVHGHNVSIPQHMMDVAKSAQQIPLPSGIDRLSMVTTALFHDIGELMGREEHGLKGKTILQNEPWIKENPLGQQMLDAIENHMTRSHQGKYDLLQALRIADASRGVGYPESRLRWPSFYNYVPLRQVYDSSKETVESNRNFINKFNEYFSKYGDPNNPQAQYPLIGTDNLLDTLGINQLAKDIIARHNTFIRGVRDFKYNKNVTEEAKQKSYLRMRELGLDPDNRTDRINFTLLYYVPDKGTGSGRVSFRPIPKYNLTGVVYTSNSLGTGAGYATSKSTGNTHNGEVALVRRPYKLGEDRDLWMQEGDFVLRGYQEGPYYDVNKEAVALFSDKNSLYDLQLQARKAYEQDPWVILLHNLQLLLRKRDFELYDMRKDAIVAFAPDEVKLKAFEQYDNLLMQNVKNYLKDINEAFTLAGLNTYDIPSKLSPRQYLYFQRLWSNLPNKVNWNNKGLMFNAIRKSKTNPQLMKGYGFNKHLRLSNLIYDLNQNNVSLNNLFETLRANETTQIGRFLNDLNTLYTDIYTEGFNPNNEFTEFYKLPKNDELNIYTSENIYKPSNKQLYKDLNYLHYLFPGPIGEKALDLVKWINRTEWVNNPDLDVTRGHSNVGGYPEATLKTFGKGGSIHIKPKNRGKFTALKKRTGHSASWFKAHGTPALKKMATFELNSRHWNKHALGGHLFLEKGFMYPQDDLTGRNILTSPIIPPNYYNLFTVPKLEPKKPLPLQPLEGTYGNKYSELIPMSDGTYVNNPINKGLQQDWRTHALEFAPFLAIGAGPAIGSTATWLASKPALYNLGRTTLGSEIGGRSVDLASNLFTGNTWGLNVGNVVKGVTGWNPNNTMVGLFVTDATNPGYAGKEGLASLAGLLGRTKEGLNNMLKNILRRTITSKPLVFPKVFLADKANASKGFAKTAPENWLKTKEMLLSKPTDGSKKDVLERLNFIYDTYGIPRLSDDLLNYSDEEFLNAITKELEKQNTYVRGVRLLPEDLKLSPEEQLQKYKEYATQYAPNTGHGRADIVKDDHTMKWLHGEDNTGTIYLSNSYDLADAYALASKRNIKNGEVDGKIVKVRLPLTEYKGNIYQYIYDNLPGGEFNASDKSWALSTLLPETGWDYPYRLLDKNEIEKAMLTDDFKKAFDRGNRTAHEDFKQIKYSIDKPNSWSMPTFRKWGRRGTVNSNNQTIEHTIFRGKPNTLSPLLVIEMFDPSTFNIYRTRYHTGRIGSDLSNFGYGGYLNDLIPYYGL